MEERYEPVERNRAGNTFDHLSFDHCGTFDELVADEISQQELVGASASQIVIEVIF